MEAARNLAPGCDTLRCKRVREMRVAEAQRQEKEARTQKQKYKPPPCTLMRTIVTNLCVDEELLPTVLDNSSRAQSHRPIPGAIEPSA